MNEAPFQDVVKEICRRDDRYDGDAYHFVREALDFTVEALKRQQADEKGRHVTGQELLNGLREYALQEFGPMALTVFKTWGITCTEDFGHIVFNLVDAGKLGRTEEDSQADFAKGYDFHDAFEKPYHPNHAGEGTEETTP